jgi:hypothetical protein
VIGVPKWLDFGGFAPLFAYPHTTSENTTSAAADRNQVFMPIAPNHQ